MGTFTLFIVAYDIIDRILVISNYLFLNSMQIHTHTLILPLNNYFLKTNTVNKNADASWDRGFFPTTTTTIIIIIIIVTFLHR